LLTGNADRWVDVVLILVRSGVDAIDGTYLEACGVLDPNTWLGDDVCGKL
jgi:hypothetical protein